MSENVSKNYGKKLKFSQQKSLNQKLWIFIIFSK
jgi:hypothetical protein